MNLVRVGTQPDRQPLEIQMQILQGGLKLAHGTLQSPLLALGYERRLMQSNRAGQVFAQGMLTPPRRKEGWMVVY